MDQVADQDLSRAAEVSLALPLARYRLCFAMPETSGLSAYPGSAWRGAFGRALKQTVCVARGTPCEQCLLVHSCVYPYVFETLPPPDSQKMRRYRAAPHPFVLGINEAEDDPCLAEPVYILGLTLFGHGNRHLPYFIHAFGRAGERGIGGRRQVLSLLEVQQCVDLVQARWRTIFQPGEKLCPAPERTPPLPPVPAAVRVHLETPLRIRSNGRNVRPQDFSFAELFGNLLRRISLLSYFHTETALEVDFAGLMAQARAMKFKHADLHWQDWTRYSSRQQTTMQMGGLRGTVLLDGEKLAPFWPYLWLGQWTHAGKSTSMGLGRYRLEMATSLPPRTQRPASLMMAV
jgi:hypothetical protein